MGRSHPGPTTSAKYGGISHAQHPARSRTISTAAMTVDGGQTVSIAGTITDADGDSLTHEWSDNGGTLSSSSTTGGVAITDWDAPAATMVDQTITISLVGNDGEDDSNTPTVVMTVRAVTNQTPMVSIQTQNMTIAGGQVVQLQATATDPDMDTLTLAWSASSNLGTFDSTAIEDAEYTGPAAGVSQQVIVLTLRGEDP